MPYFYKKQLTLPFDEALQKTKEALDAQDFGVLMELDISGALNKKINAVMGKYVILGACSPKHAYEAIKAEIDIGLLLPCNIAVYQDGNKVFASAIMPSVAMSIVESPELINIAIEIEGKLKSVIDLI